MEDERALLLALGVQRARQPKCDEPHCRGSHEHDSSQLLGPATNTGGRMTGWTAPAVRCCPMTKPAPYAIASPARIAAIRSPFLHGRLPAARPLTRARAVSISVSVGR